MQTGTNFANARRFRVRDNAGEPPMTSGPVYKTNNRSLLPFLRVKTRWHV